MPLGLMERLGWLSFTGSGTLAGSFASRPRLSRFRKEYLGATSEGPGRLLVPRRRRRGVWFTFRSARSMALSFFFPSCSHVNERAQCDYYAGVLLAHLVVEVLQPPFRHQIALNLPSSVSPVTAQLFGRAVTLRTSCWRCERASRPKGGEAMCDARPSPNT